MDYEELAEQFLVNMFQFQKGQHHKKIDESMHGEVFVMLYIARKGVSVLPGEISSTMQISSARIAAALNNMEKKGLITRRMDTADRRKILVDLTEEGHKYVDKFNMTAHKKAVQVLKALGEDDAREFVRIMGKLAEFSQSEMFHDNDCGGDCFDC